MKFQIFIGTVCAALLVACSEGSSSADGKYTSKYGEVRSGSCVAGLGDDVILKKTVELDMSAPAEISKKESGDYEIMIPPVNDYCGIYASVIMEVSGDTLHISYDMDGATVTDCVCYKAHFFDVPKNFVDAKYVTFDNQTFKVVRKD